MSQHSGDLPSVPSSTWRWAKWALAVGLLVLAGLATWQIIAGRARAARAPRYELSPVQRGDVVTQVTASGTLKPTVQVEVGSQVSGRVKQLLVDFNDPVKKGQLVAVIDPELFDSALGQAQARLEAAKADLERAVAQADDARAQVARVSGLGESGAVSRAEVETARTGQRTADAAVASARAQVTLAKAAVDQAQANLAYCRITSPTDGVVVSRSVDVGQTVAASFSAPTLFVIAEDLRKMEVHTNVSESDVGQIVPAQSVEFTVDAYPEQTFKGTVRQVRYAAQTVSNVVTYDAVVQVENDELKLRPGMTANVSFIVQQRRGVLTVPTAAFRFRPASAGVGPQAGIWVLRAGKPAAVPARAGLSDGSTVEVLDSALAEGEQVILGDGSKSVAAAPVAGSAGGGKSTNRQGPGGGGPSPPPGIF